MNWEVKDILSWLIGEKTCIENSIKNGEVTRLKGNLLMDEAMKKATKWIQEAIANDPRP